MKPIQRIQGLVRAIASDLVVIGSSRLVQAIQRNSMALATKLSPRSEPEPEPTEADMEQVLRAFAKRGGFEPQLIVDLAEEASPGATQLTFSTPVPEMRGVKMVGPEADEVLFVDRVSGNQVVLRRPTAQGYAAGAKGKVLQ